MRGEGGREVNNLQIDFVEILIVQFLEDSGSGFFAIK